MKKIECRPREPISLQIRQRLAAVALILSFSGAAANAAVEPAANSSKTLKGSVSLAATAGVSLEKMGIHYHEVPLGASSVLVVDNVTAGSPAYGHGINSGDCIVSVRQSGSNYHLSIGRTGNMFHVDLSPLSAVTAHASGNTLSGSTIKSGAVLTAQVPAMASLPAVVPVTQQRWPVVPVTQKHWPELNVNPRNIPVVDVNQGPFPVEQIRQEADSGVEQGNFGDCWFEGTLAAFANIPRGQALISSMIRQGASGTYVVTFKGERKPTTVTLDEAVASGLNDRSRWALLIEDACIKNHDPQEVGSSLSRGGGPAIQVAMELMTGLPATVVRADQYSDDQLGSMLDRLVRSQTPVSLSTKSPRETGGMPPILTANHCYSLVDYNASSREVTIRNAYGREPDFPADYSAGVQNLGDGRVLLPVSLLPTYIRYIAYPSSNNY